MDGRSLAGLLAFPDPGWRDQAFAEHSAHGTDRPRAMLRRGRWKLCLSGAEDLEPELYDVVTDPGEFTNLAGDPAAAGVQRHMTDGLLSRCD